MEVVVNGQKILVPRKDEARASLATGFDVDGSGNLVFVNKLTTQEKDAVLKASIAPITDQVNVVAAKCPEVLDLLIALNLLPEQAKNL
jgi:hypothetical protein